MKRFKQIFYFMLFPLSILFLFCGVTVSATESLGDVTITLEQQESTTDDTVTAVRYIGTVTNVSSLDTITNVQLNLTLYKYGTTMQESAVSSEKLYTSVSGTNGKSAADNTYYAVFTLTDATSFNDYTLSAYISLKASGVTVKSNEISYTINDSGDTFIKGMDASAVPSLENVGVEYYNYGSDTSEDVFKILADNGVNYIRVRVWNDPYDSNGKGYGGGNCDLANAIAIGKRANKYGMKLLVDFQYSDFWADPGKQILPKAWAKYTTAQIVTAVYDFTYASLTSMKNAGIDVGMVQVGNETNDSMCGLMGEEGTMETVCSFMSSGSKAVRAVYPDALVALHFADPHTASTYYWYASELSSAKVDYDVFGTSYYPYWHGTQENLSTVLTTIATTYKKKVMVMETSYANNDTAGYSDGFSNTVYTRAQELSDDSNADLEYDFTVDGQKSQITELMNTIAAIKTSTVQYGIGICYWEGTWIGATNFSSESTTTLWNEYGVGVGTTYASSYYSEWAAANSDWVTSSGKSSSDYEITSAWGCAVENEAFFDSYGHAYSSIEVFKTDISITLPWVTTSSSSDSSSTTTTATLTNGDFESGTDNWTVTYSGSWGTTTDYDPQSNDYCVGFGNGDSAYTAEIYQTISGDGTYAFSIYAKGQWSGDNSTSTWTSSSTVKVYYSIGGTKTYCSTTSLSTSGKGNWIKFTTDEFTISSSQTVLVGVEISGVAYYEIYLDNATLTQK